MPQILVSALNFTCSENFLYESLSSGNTPVVKKVSCGVEFAEFGVLWSELGSPKGG